MSGIIHCFRFRTPHDCGPILRDERAHDSAGGPGLVTEGAQSAALGASAVAVQHCEDGDAREREADARRDRGNRHSRRCGQASSHRECIVQAPFAAWNASVMARMIERSSLLSGGTRRSFSTVNPALRRPARILV